MTVRKSIFEIVFSTFGGKGLADWSQINLLEVQLHDDNTVLVVLAPCC